MVATGTHSFLKTSDIMRMMSKSIKTDDPIANDFRLFHLLWQFMTALCCHLT